MGTYKCKPDKIIDRRMCHIIRIRALLFVFCMIIYPMLRPDKEMYFILVESDLPYNMFLFL